MFPLFSLAAFLFESVNRTHRNFLLKKKIDAALPLIYDDKQNCLLDAAFCLLWISPPRCG